LCHGNPTWSFLYRDIIIALRDRFRCIAPDYLGFGLSERPDGFGYTIDEHARVVGELVDHLGLDGYLTMGQDWGGPISMAVAVQPADRVRGVVLGNIPPGTEHRPSAAVMDHYRAVQPNPAARLGVAQMPSSCWRPVRCWSALAPKCRPSWAPSPHCSSGA
jgi:haloalkane dehalogenase